MKNRLLMTIAAALLVGALALSGCSGKSVTTPTAQAAAATKLPGRPALVIPNSFENEAAKRDFAMKAVDAGYYRESKKLLEESATTEPNALVFQRLGIVHYNLDDYQAAIDAWNKAADLDLTLYGEMQNNIGNALRDQRKLGDAEAAYRKSLKVEPARSSAAINLASILRDQGRLKEAIGVLEAAVPASSDSTVLTSLIKAYKSEG